MLYYLAIDIGASSGRHIVGWEESGEIRTEEVFRFANGVKEEDGHLIWDIESLTESVKKGIDEALARYPEIRSLSIDTWGVDYVLMDGDKEILPCYAYRDSRTEEVIPQVHALVSREEAYQRTGIAFQPFNTIYQLYSDKLAGRLEKATDYLMMPQYLLYKLCGTKVQEYTDATTGGLVNASTGTYDEEMIDRLGLPRRLFGELVSPGTAIGEYKGITCVVCASHDTASAVEGIDMEGNHPYISSGTWSLFGIKSPKAICTEESRLANWSNEGGVGYFRYLKNIMGMWLVNRLRAELCPDKSFGDIVKEAEESTFDETVDANKSVFLAPKSMKEAFLQELTEKPAGDGDFFRCAYRSLALCYKASVEELERNTGMTFEKIYIVGGGAKNAFLNRLTEEATGRKVVALPIEATSLGNLKIQMRR